MNSAYVTTRAAASALNLDPATLTRWVKAGKITPAYRTPGGHLRWDVADLRRQLGAPDPAAAEKAPAVAAAVIVSGLGVLITRRTDGVPPFGFLTGKIENGESPANAAVRECKEEVGLDIRPTGTIADRLHPKTARRMYYVAAVPVGSTAVSVIDTRELSGVLWATLREADELTAEWGGIYGPVREWLEREIGSGSPDSDGEETAESA